MLHIDAVGPANAKTIVFLHGGGVAGWMWEPQIKALSGQYRCLNIDMPEHGKSRDEQPFTIQDTASRIAGIIRSHVRGGKANVVGLSLGAQVTTALLGMAPEVIDHAMITGTLVRPIPGAWMIGATAATYMPFRNIDWLVKANMKSLGVPIQYLEQFREDTRQLTTTSFTHVTTENMRFTMPTTLAQANVPTLIMVGQKELGAMINSAKDLLKVLPNAQGRLAPNVGHNWSLEAPELFTRTLQAWIEDQPLPAELLPLN